MTLKMQHFRGCVLPFTMLYYFSRQVFLKSCIECIHVSSLGVLRYEIKALLLLKRYDKTDFSQTLHSKLITSLLHGKWHTKPNGDKETLFYTCNHAR